ncbi:glycosyltransferase family 4 protein [Nocardiopsis sp. LDBS1602]|uniref:glycosyltransferase family 4 protein n=1 Tax=Nocardiopsis sp. LDBS1602 TaxID=3109597 RepID=UPI002DB660BF|nr:glycosyltransferase family 4 protein [Nocardiopsis sp. LDBS1602]MEC3891824.1 glycosyltransferase family 4 protein [Nocardiopsis sp. LDBS1602]
MRILTGIDLPATAPGGSVELLHDLYTIPEGPLTDLSWAWMLGPQPLSGRKVALLDGAGKCVQGPPFRHYVAHLADQLRNVAPTPDVLHLHHLAFGASPAMLQAFPTIPALALIHGTDLLYARVCPTQRTILTRVAHRAQVVVAPTPAMADQLSRMVPDLPPGRIVHVPWGVPDSLLAAPPPRPTQRRPGPLRLLFAGRLTPEKGADELLAACREAGAQLSVAAPTPPDADVRYLGWFDRPALWAEFAHHDLLVVPSTWEAFCLVAIEAQACGLPVLYRDVPVLNEVLGTSAIPIPDLSKRTLAATLAWLVADHCALDQAREFGYRNAARFPLSATANALRDLSENLSRDQ